MYIHEIQSLDDQIGVARLIGVKKIKKIMAICLLCLNARRPQREWNARR